MFRYDQVAHLTDQAYIDDLCDRVEQGLDQGLLPSHVFRDERVFKVEMDRIFTRAWVFVAHETEIPKSGDFVLRKVGLDQVIVTRSAGGAINVLLNHCRHRGTEVCHEDSGNTTHFKCPYHGWIYKNDGDFVGAPAMREAYGGRLDSKKNGLLRAPQVESYHGFIFTCLSESGPSLSEYLGDVSWMLDAIVKLHPAGLKVLGAPERFIIRTDWKIGAENFAGDVYHIATAHLSVNETKYISQDMRDTLKIGGGYRFQNGHGFITHRLSEMVGAEGGLWAYGLNPEIRKQFDLEGFDDAQKKMLLEAPPVTGNIFPNFSYLRGALPANAGDLPVVFTNFRLWQPVEPGVMEVWNWQFSYDALPDEYNREAYAAGQLAFSAAGLFDQDDSAVWEGVAKLGGSPWGRKEEVMLHYGQQRVEPDSTYEGKGDYFPSTFGEFNQENFWREWVKQLRSDVRNEVPA
uniref:Phenylurea herbicides N-demethylase alpha subunit n=1 Tax=Sphingomonas sp. SH TaxID=849864 RepID=A0A125QWU1_9SPHN|nr:Rieske 2Fe-2S domain-containing protein [Sphingomonas sp. SH]ALZ45880.1 phenylurea herbicides N-demethylase alpha subunit [Sphingomonas sp. SH]